MRLRWALCGVLVLIAAGLLTVAVRKPPATGPRALRPPVQAVASSQTTRGPTAPVSPLSQPSSPSDRSPLVPPTGEEQERSFSEPSYRSPPVPAPPTPSPPSVPPSERPPVVTPLTPPPIGGQLPGPASPATGAVVIGGFFTGPSGGSGTGTTEPGGEGEEATSPGTTPGGEPPSPTGPSSELTITPVTSPPRFREVGIALGDAVDVSAVQGVTFPLALSLTYDPREPQIKGVPPELIEAFFFDEDIGTWSTDGLQVKSIDVSDGLVSFETTHLTIFRLGIPRGRPPTIHQARPQAVGPNGPFGVWGRGFSLPAAQNLITFGGSFVTLALDPQGSPQSFTFNDEGETLTLLDAQGAQLDQAQLSAPPTSRSSWTRQTDGDEQSPFVLHSDVALGRLFSPGTRANGDAFVVSRGNVSQPPAPGDLVINEVLLVPPNSFLGDANGDGETNPHEDAFVELVNTTDHPLELGGCRLLTQNGGERHQFPEGTMLPGGMAVVLFGVEDAANPAQPAGPFGGRRIFPDTSGAKRLIARAPSEIGPGTDFVQVTTLRQTSNPVTFQLLTPLGERLPAFEDQSAGVGPIAQLSLRGLQLGDLDRDLDLDLVALTGNAEVVLGGNDGFGGFTELAGRLTLPAGRSRFFDAALADLTEDGAPELILGDTDQTGSYTQLFVFGNNGGGYFQLVSQQGVLNSPASSGPSALALGDVDDDGDLDVVVAMIGDAPIVFRNDGSSQFSHLPGQDVLPQSQVVVPSNIQLADLDGDGDLDVLLSAGRAGLGGFSDVQLFINNGNGQFADETASRLPVRSEGIESLAIGDIDGDAALDVAASGLLTAPRLYHNNGSGVFTLADTAALSSARAATVLLEDLDGDGDLDLIFSQPPRDLVYLNNGSGAFTALAPLPEVGGDHRETAAADVDNDGDLDLLGVGSLTLLLNTGTRANHPPQIDAVSDQLVIEGDALAVDVTAHDPDADPLTLTAGLLSGDPLSTIGAFFTDLGAGQGTLHWTPGSNQGLRGGKLYEVVVEAHDGLVAASRTIRIFVHDLNHAPTLAPIDPQTVEELEPLSIQLQAQDEDLDDVLTFGSMNRPSGSSLNSSSGLFQWTPGPTQGDGPQGFVDYPVTFTVTDLALATVQQDVTIRVLHRNHAPVFMPVGPQTVAEGQLLQLILAASDPDGDQVTVSDVELPGGATFDDATRTFRWTPDFTQARAEPYLARFAATDQALGTILEISITVLDTHVNQPPVLGALSDQTVLEGHLLQFAFPVSDPDGDPLTVAVSPLPRGARVFQQGAVWLFQWVPGMDQSGVYPMTIEVTDGLVASPTMGDVAVDVIENPGFQPLVAQVGRINSDAVPASTPGADLGTMAFLSWTPGMSLVLDLGEVHPALVSMLEVFHSESAMGLAEADLSLWVSDDNVAYQAYAGPKVVNASGNRLVISNLNITQRYIKIHRLPGSDPQVTVSNFLPEIVRASGAIPLDEPTTAFLDDLGHKTFLYFANHVNANGLIPDRVAVSGDQAFPGDVFSTGTTGFWLASLPIAAERGWMTQADAQNAARRTLEFYLGEQGGPVEGHLGFYHHFLNGDGTRFTGFGDDGVSTIDSAILFMGALACGQYFGGDIQTLALTLFDRADWEGFYDHGMNLLHQVWTPAQGFGRHIDYTSEGILAYLLAAGSTTHPIVADADLPGGGSDAYYAYSRGNFGRILGRFGRDGRPLLQSFFGSLFTYLYPSLLMDSGGLRDAFYFNWEENTREAVLANFRFAQEHPEAGYSRLYWGLSASDGPQGYQALYGAPPLDPGSGGVTHDGTVAPYALAGSLAYAADLALPALQHLASLQNGRLFDLYGLKSGVNVLQDFFGSEYLGIDQGALLLGLERYRTGQVAQLVRHSPVIQQALTALGLQTAPHLPLALLGPRSQHAYLIVDTTDHLTQTVQVARPSLHASGDLLLELHPFGMDNARGDRFVDVELRVNGQFLKTVRFLDRRGTGVVDVGSVYVPISPAALAQEMNTIELMWVGGERWVQLQDVELSGPTGRLGTQEFWQIGSLGTPFEFGDERRVNDSYLVGDDVTTLEQALNVIDEPITDILFELQDAEVDRLLRLVADDTHNALGVTVEVSINDAVAGTVTLHPDEEGTVNISHLLLREGWNHIRLRHTNAPNEGEWILWDTLAFERQPGSGALQVLLRNVQGDQLAPQIQFGLAPPEGAVMSALQYIEIHYQLDEAADRVTISTDNRNAPIHRFTGPSDVSAAGLVGAVDSAITVPLLWQVYDTTQPAAPAFTDTVEWAYVPDASDADFTTPDAVNYRTLASPAGVGDRPSPGRSGSSPVFVYLTADFRGKPSQPYGTDRLLIEIVQQ